MFQQTGITNTTVASNLGKQAHEYGKQELCVEKASKHTAKGRCRVPHAQNRDSSQSIKLGSLRSRCKSCMRDKTITKSRWSKVC